MVELLLLPTIILVCVLISLVFKAVADRLGADWLFQLPWASREESAGVAPSAAVSRYRLSPE